MTRAGPEPWKSGIWITSGMDIPVHDLYMSLAILIFIYSYLSCRTIYITIWGCLMAGACNNDSTNETCISISLHSWQPEASSSIKSFFFFFAGAHLDSLYIKIPLCVGISLSSRVQTPTTDDRCLCWMAVNVETTYISSGMRLPNIYKSISLYFEVSIFP